jgi:hypothetical protein
MVVAAGAPAFFSLSPLAVRAFTPVFDGLWRGSGYGLGEGAFRRLRLAETPPPQPSPHSASMTHVNVLMREGDE